MDSKQKFIKNRYWKRKYRPQNATFINVSQPMKPTNEISSDLSEEKFEDEFELKQPIPEEGWFPESDSSFSSDDFEYFESITNDQSFKKPLDNHHKCDKNWFDKELDNIQLTSDNPATEKSEIIIENKNKLKSVYQEPQENKYQSSESKLKSCNIKKNADEKNSINNAIDKEEEDLEFLLSLKEPIHTRPVTLKKNIENERKLTASSSSYMEKIPVKSIDLEKWLDSVLDD